MKMNLLSSHFYLVQAHNSTLFQMCTWLLFCFFFFNHFLFIFNSSAVIVYENQQAKSSAKVFTRDSEPLDPTTRTATFRFKVNGGTRKLPVQVKFQVNTQVGTQALSIDSQPSEPFIVITNECQVSCTFDTFSIYSKKKQNKTK